ncbi:hypothetical protein QC764_207380 [Podospora pseudoanserina]|uniref:Integral membrane protein n=1 Tax=Podospora pseudoanserina TaxID=2609844 RepID=A0ABR0II98_9PEZI|nr:hypothetical protein QC764_207380 [Podospora pseudoanserina]
MLTTRQRACCKRVVTLAGRRCTLPLRTGSEFECLPKTALELCCCLQTFSCSTLQLSPRFFLFFSKTFLPSRTEHSSPSDRKSHTITLKSQDEQLTMAPSQLSALQYAAHAFATIFTGFGINAILRPQHALTFFEFAPPASAADAKMVDSLMAVYGARDIFMGVAIYAAALFGTKKSLGWTLVAASGVAVVDGIVCWSHGQGEWNHWGYAPMITAVGAVLLGILDGAPAPKRN